MLGQWIIQHWIAVAIAAVMIGAGISIGMAAVSDTPSGIEMDEGATEVLAPLENEPSAAAPHSTLPAKSTVPKSTPTPTPPVSETPWGQGESEQGTPAASTPVPNGQAPWGGGPSQ
ncbi:MAG: hypothetical protein PHR51_02740 [Patescibacteria group bacterium]|nr:hypothetical protein [Patescibacteria group bacterium]